MSRHRSLMTSTYAVAALALAALVTSIARPAGAQQTAPGAAPVRMVDETELNVQLWTPSPSGGYVFRIRGTVYGVGSNQDALRITVKQGDRTLVEARCPLNNFDSDTHAAALRCETASDHLLTATGDVSVELVYDDDNTSTRELIRTLNLHVNRYPYWTGNQGNRPVIGGRYQISGDDLLGTAFVYRNSPSVHQTEAHAEQNVSFYTAFSGFYNAGSVQTLRCSVDGQRLQGDIRGSLRSYADFNVDEWTAQNAEQRHLGWYRARFNAQNLWWGPRVPFPSNHSGYNTANTTFLGEHPGQWSCELRVDGNTLRTFLFTVTPDGVVAPHAEQQGLTGMRLLNGVSIVDVRLPNPDAVDAIVNPAAIRAASQYGRPWANPDAVREMLGALPPAVGSSDASRPGAAAGGRRGHRQ